MPKSAEGMMVKATRKGHYLYLREEGDVFKFTAVKGVTKDVVAKSTWMEPTKEPAPAPKDEDPESESE